MVFPAQKLAACLMVLAKTSVRTAVLLPVVLLKVQALTALRRLARLLKLAALTMALVRTW